MSVFDVDKHSLIGFRIDGNLVVTQDDGELVLEPARQVHTDAFDLNVTPTLNINEKLLRIFRGFPRVHVKDTHLEVSLSDLDCGGVSLVCDDHLTLSNTHEVNNLNLEGQFIYLSRPTTFNNCHLRAQKVFTYNNLVIFNNCEIETHGISVDSWPSQWDQLTEHYRLNNSKILPFIEKDTE